MITHAHEDIGIFIDCTHRLHCEHLQYDIDQFLLSVSSRMADKTELLQDLVDKWSITPVLANRLADILIFMSDKDEITTGLLVSALGFTETTAKRYLRQLTACGNRNRSYRKKAH